MPHTFLVVGSELLCKGDGMDLLRLKASLSSFLGPEQIRTINAKSFSMPLESALAASSIFKEICGMIPNGLSREVSLYAEHELARVDAMRGILENEILPLENPWPDILDPAQAVAVTAMVKRGLFGLCLFDEQGIGKTLMGLAAFDVLFQRGEANCLMIICPVTMMASWKQDIERFLPNKYRIVLINGSAQEKRKNILSPFDIMICNFESVTSLLVPLKGVLGNKKTILVVDESFNVKNKEAIRSVAVRDLRRSCIKGFVLCGTPAPNSPIDIINQFDIADDGFTFAGFHPPKDMEQAVQSISQRVEARGTLIRRLKEEVLPLLPKKHFNVISVAMSGRQAALYEDARGKLELNLKRMDNATFKKSLTTYFQQRSALLQICACPEVIDPMYPDVSAKLVALDELIERLVEKGNKKLIVWSFYRASLDSIYERYKKYSPVLLDGSSSASQRAESVQLFQSDPSVRLCIANPAAAGAGVTLHAASDAAYISFSNQAAHFLQSIDRVHRRGQQAPNVDYHLLVCKGTIEETEVQRLREKEVRQHELLGDRVKWPNSLDEALSELTQSYV